ncbi:MAG: hypothetical protein J7621_16975 [Niastella sp.]|nr:hypothetical protein [Niastella sp.]
MKITYAAPTPALQRLFWWLLLVNILFIIGARFYFHPLTSGEIVRFEVAKETSVAEHIIQEWKHAGKFDKAVQSIYIDYLFIILYTTGLSVACVYLSRLTGHEILIRTGKVAPWLLIVAAVCDVIENVAMTRSLLSVVSRWNVTLAYDMAAAKFSIIILCLLFILVCLIFWGSNKLFRGKNSFTFF